MTASTLRITPDGTIRGLWSEAVGWQDLGRVTVTRASYVEFSDRSQIWYVQAGRPKDWLRRVLQHLLGRPFGDILHWARTREEALTWERGHYEPGGPGWTADKTPGNAIPTADSADLGCAAQQGQESRR